MQKVLMNKNSNKTHKYFNPFKVVYVGDGNTPFSLTLGNFYLVINYWTQYEFSNSGKPQESFYTITNDVGISLSYNKSLFKTLDEVRDEKIKEILN